MRTLSRRRLHTLDSQTCMHRVNKHLSLQHSCQAVRSTDRGGEARNGSLMSERWRRDASPCGEQPAEPRCKPAAALTAIAAVHPAIRAAVEGPARAREPSVPWSRPRACGPAALAASPSGTDLFAAAFRRMEGGLPPLNERGEAFAGFLWYDAPPADLEGPAATFPPLQLDLLQPIAGGGAPLPPGLLPLPPLPADPILVPLDGLGGGSGLQMPVDPQQVEAEAPAARGGRRKASEEERRARNRATQQRFRERQKVGAAAPTVSCCG